MSVAFSSARPRSKSEVTQQAIQKMLDENHHLIQCIMDCQSKGKTVECTQYQQILHRNLVYLATIADSNQNMQSLLPAPPSSNMSMDPGRMSQSGGHASSNLNDNMGPLPPYMIQGQLSNGPSHALMQSGHMQSAITSASSNTSSVSNYSPATPSSQGSLIQDPWSGYGSSSSSTPSSSSFPRSNLNTHSSQVSMMHQQSAPPQHSSANSGRRHYQGHQSMSMMGQTNQGNNTIPQRPMGPYRPSQQGSAQHYMGQEEFYGEQYGHTQNSTELTNQQYYTDDYSYHHSSYGEQGYERSFGESSQHYYEGGNSQYSQQQGSYQQSTGQQPAFSQEQYSSQQGYSGQPQGYGPSQGGPSQFSQYQQSQNQQYGSYHSSQGGPAGQTQRSFTYEQGQYGNLQQ
ncbi:PREDICTED: calcium-responsive transactivator isoform X5 [Cyprinodon variegatus]|uniref:calcium-responsive transactivator isoform X5 n=1 Tax=Cyprinodon variegatus TaxID=28743 RepID=UPI000742A31A|nr:PREDICTED: calcium-responsive transactivator isoform X5 [Cyprinodon variegatus]